MTTLSEIYNVIDNLRGKAGEGFIRPTLNQFFNSTQDFENISSYHDPIFLTKILAPDGAATDWSGISVATSDTKIVIGARGDDNVVGNDSGSAYIFNTDGTYVTKLTAPDGALSDWFGHSVAISNTRIVVGAVYDDTPGGTNAGSAYIFNTDGTYVTKLTAPDGAVNDYFGYSVAISDTKIVVGASYDDTPGGADAGSAYIFNTDGTYVTKLTAPDGVAYDYFGTSVAISDTKIIVGAYQDDSARGTNVGSAYIFNTDGTYITKITAPDGATDDHFGWSVAVSDTKIVVGAYQRNTPDGSNAGSAYIFNTDGTYITKITAPDGAANDYFGNSVAISDTRIVVGAYQDDTPGGSNAGSAYIFNTDGTYVTKLIAPDGAADDYFGNSVAISDTRIVVGAYTDDNIGGSNAGAAYIYDI